MYPEEAWAGVEDRLAELQRHQPEARAWVLSMLATAVEVAPDGQGRILIPSPLRESAELDGQVLLVGAIDKVEIWDPAQFEELVREKAPEFEHFAAQVFR